MKSDSAAISVPSTDAAAKYPPEMEEIALESETKTTDKQTQNTTTKTAQKGPNMSSFYLQKTTTTTKQKQKQKQNKTNKKNAHILQESSVLFTVSFKQVHRYISSQF